ncbi:MAG: substrate-binding domain-containing protein [Pyrinomonadaceae bacterium]|nr:substrate-binding domain-containing protein [Pyrinomonadaceae bacterium]
MRLARQLSIPLIAITLLISGCVSAPQQNANENAPRNNTGAGGRVRIGFSMDTLKEERWQRDKELVEARARELGADLDVQVANGDDAVQRNQAESMLTKGVDVLIVAPHNGEAAAAIVEAAHRQRIPVISYDRLIKNSDVDLYVSHQVEKMGEMQARYAIEHAPKGNYVLIGGSQTDNNAILLRKGQMNILQPVIDRGDIKVISNQFAREWLASEALRITEDAMTKTGGDIQAVVASNDGTAGGAVQALGDRAKSVIVTGQDAQLDAVQRIVEGRQSMTIYKQIKPLAYSAVESAIKLARGEKPEAADRVNNGKIDVPSILQEPIAVDKNNVVQTVIKDGYHKMEDVYKNVPRDQWPQTTAQVRTPGAENNFVLALLLSLRLDARELLLAF